MAINEEIIKIAIALCYIIGAYIVGSIPTGYLIARLQGIEDIRQYGSGNIGATNVARVIGIPYFFIVLLLDALKAYGYLVMGRSLSIDPLAIDVALLFLLIGNSYSCFLHFTGGKGIGTLVGILAALSLPLLYVFAFVWLIVFFFTHIAGLASMSALLFLPCVSYWNNDSYIKSVMFITLWCLLRHKNNIKQLIILCARIRQLS